MWMRESAYRVFVGKREGKRTLGRHSRIGEDNIKTDLQEVVWGVIEWTYLTQNSERLRAVVKGGGNGPSGSIKWREFLD
jgi:hypothetical protein